MMERGTAESATAGSEHRHLTVVRTPPINLPTPLTPLIAREREAATLVEWICQENERLVTLTGPGGVGKTRLALQVAREVAKEFGDGVYFVGLAAVISPALVLPAIAQTFGMAEPGGDSTTTRLRSFLRTRRLLLVLDNFEHVVDAAPEVAALLSDCHHLSILVTSRALLSIRGERAFAVQSLDMPPQGVVWDEPTAAVRLFMDRARAVRFDIPDDADTTQAVAEICRRLDGLPLAIELAAARANVLRPRDLLARLAGRCRS